MFTGICLGPYGGLRGEGGAVSYERGTPVRQRQASQEGTRGAWAVLGTRHSPPGEGGTPPPGEGGAGGGQDLMNASSARVDLGTSSLVLEQGLQKTINSHPRLIVFHNGPHFIRRRLKPSEC